MIDGFRGHLGVRISKFCLENDIKLWLYPPNTTHVLQTLDQVFGPVKHRMKTLSHNWHGKIDNIKSGKKLDQYTMMSDCVYKAFEATFKNPKVIESAWRKCGIIPWNMNNVDMGKLNPSKMFVSTNNDNINNTNNFNNINNTSNANNINNTNNIDNINNLNNLNNISNVNNDNNINNLSNINNSNNFNNMNNININNNSNINSHNIINNANNTNNFNNSINNEFGRTINSNNNNNNQNNTVNSITSTAARSQVMALQESLTYEDKQLKLRMFELMHQDQVPLFKDLFETQELDVPSVDYQVWLLLKKQALGTEAEAISRVASANIPKDIQKSGKKRASNFPGGADRYDPTCPSFIEALADSEERSAKRAATSMTRQVTLPKGKSKASATVTSANLAEAAPSSSSASETRKERSAKSAAISLTRRVTLLKGKKAAPATVTSANLAEAAPSSSSASASEPSASKKVRSEYVVKQAPLVLFSALNVYFFYP